MKELKVNCIRASWVVMQGIFYLSTARMLKIGDLTAAGTFGVFLLLSSVKDGYSMDKYLLKEEVRKQVILHGEFLLNLYIIGSFLREDKGFARYSTIVLFFFIYNILLLLWIRLIFRGTLKRRVVIVGTGENAVHIDRVLKGCPLSLYKPLGYIAYEEKGAGRCSEEDIICSHREFTVHFQGEMVDELIVALSKENTEVFMSTVREIEEGVKNIKFIAEHVKGYGLSTSVEYCKGLLLVSASSRLENPVNKIIKRVMDIGSGILGLILLLPITGLVWLKTEKKDRGSSLFFIQPRIGYLGRPIKIIKFRSMVLDAERILEELMSKDPRIRREYLINKKLKTDPRVTAIGRRLRESSIDEFPQFINIVRGEMSLVGPRPYLHREIEDMGGSYRSIVRMKPGLTGMWQANGRSDTTFQERLEYDEYYYRNWSIWLDLLIILKTLRGVLLRRGAV